MLLIELTTLQTSSRYKDLGIKVDDTDFIKVVTFIDINKITHMTENPDDSNITNIYLTNGSTLLTGIPVKDLVSYMQRASNE